MIKNNKVINKILLPEMLALCSLIAVSSAACMYAVKPHKNQTINDNKTKNIFSISVVALLVMFSFIYVFSEYKQEDKLLKLVARKYLKNEMKNNPDFKLFEKVLDNPKAMQNMSAMIFNSLRPSEIKRIARIVKNTHDMLRDGKNDILNDAQYLLITKELFINARNKIIPIIQEHASLHPEFIGNVYSTMAHADMMYIMTTNQTQQHTK